MIQTLAVALAIGFASGGKDMTEVRQTNRWLLVGTWVWELRVDCLVVWNFRRDGRFTNTAIFPGEPVQTVCGTYRVERRRVTLHYGCGANEAFDLVQLDRRLLVLRWDGLTHTLQYRRR